MSFTKKPERPTQRPSFRGPPALSGLLLRTLLVGIFAIFGAAWAVVRHYTQTLPPLRVPVAPREVPTFDADAGELPVPDLVVPDGEAR